MLADARLQRHTAPSRTSSAQLPAHHVHHGHHPSDPESTRDLDYCTLDFSIAVGRWIAADEMQPARCQAGLPAAEEVEQGASDIAPKVFFSGRLQRTTVLNAVP